MEKKKIDVRKIIISLSFIMMYIIIAGSITLSSSTGESYRDLINNGLVEENEKLKGNISKLENRLYEIENQLKKTKEYDNRIYSEMLGVKYDTVINFKNNGFVDTLSKYDSIFKLIDEKSIAIAEQVSSNLVKMELTYSLLHNDKNAIDYYPTISPIKTKDFIKISSPYGFRKDPFTGNEVFHKGIDISAKTGSPVIATASGIVVNTSYSQYGYGNKIVIEHKYGFETLYAHMKTINVIEGQYVNKGDIIATVGNIGRSTGPHLHYEVIKNKKLKNPLGYFYSYLTSEKLAMK